MPKWKVEIRDNCKVCGGDLPNSRFRTYCSTKCRARRNNQRQISTGYSRNWQRNKRKCLAIDKKLDKLLDE